MNIARFFGRRLIVDYDLLKDLRIQDVRQDVRHEERIKLVVEGSIMESAKVFETLKIVTTANKIFVTIYASLAFWNRSGSPEFKTSTDLTLMPGVYTVWYVGENSKQTFLKEINVE